MKQMQLVVLVSMLALLGSGVALAAQPAPSVEQGKALFNDGTLGTSGKSCGSCHADGKGMEKVSAQANLPAMINVCIARPLQGKPLDVNSVEMQSLVLYIKSLAKP